MLESDDLTLRETVRIGFVGAGRMATALAGGLVRAGALTSEQITLCDSAPAACDNFLTTIGGHARSSVRELAASADVIVLAVKPKHLPPVMTDLRGQFDGKLVLSLAAGVSLKSLAEGLGGEVRVIRAIPNTPVLVGAGASAYAVGDRATEADVAMVDRLFAAVGRVYRVEEALLDAVAGLSGSGPAFVYYMIGALRDGGVQLGLPSDLALELAAATIRGAGEMVLETGAEPGALKDQVASVGGTTIAGLQLLEQGGVREHIIAAVAIAAKRAREQAGRG